jgi:hypothetical protein
MMHGFKLLVVNLVRLFKAEDLHLSISVIAKGEEFQMDNETFVTSLSLSNYKDPSRTLTKDSIGPPEKAYSHSICDELLFPIDAKLLTSDASYILLRVFGKTENAPLTRISLLQGRGRLNSKALNEIGFATIKLAFPIQTKAYSLKFIRSRMNAEALESASNSKDRSLTVNLKVFNYQFMEHQLRNGLVDRLAGIKNYNRKRDVAKKVGHFPNNFPPHTYLPNGLAQYSEFLFKDSDRVHFTIFKLRNVAPNSTVIRCVLRFFSVAAGKFVGKTVGFTCELQSSCIFPNFQFTYQLGPGDFDRTTFIFLTFLTFEDATYIPKVVGYASLNLFISKYTFLPPTNDQDKNVHLMDGLYELPLMGEPRDPSAPFALEKFLSGERVPGISTLVKISTAPVQFTPQFMDETNYAKDIFNNMMFDPTEKELHIMAARFRKVPILMSAKARSIYQHFTGSLAESDSDLRRMIESKLRLENATGFLPQEK